jgi:hypothetical protein
MRSHFLRLRIRPANRDIPRNSDASLPECWLIAEWARLRWRCGEPGCDQGGVID